MVYQSDGTVGRDVEFGAVQAGTLILGVVSLAGIVGATDVYQPASSYIYEAAGLAIAATAFIFTAAVTRSQAVRSRR